MISHEIAFSLPSQEVSSEEVVTPHVYAQEMHALWQRVQAIQQIEETSPQRNATMFDLWKLSRTDTPITPDNYPTLAGHGLIKQRRGDDRRWEPTFPHLQDFWEIGSEVTFTYGYRAVPQVEFQNRLQAKLATLFPVEQ